MADGSWKPSALLGSGELRNVVQSLVVYLDDVKGIIRATSAERPANPKAGWPIYETDTQRLLVFDGSAWQRLGWGGSAGRTGAQYVRAANQSIPNAATTAISFDTLTAYGTDAWTAVTTSTVTWPTGADGLYVLSGNVNWAASPATRNVALFTINGVNRGLVGAAGDGSVGTTWCQPFAAGDTLQFRVGQTSGAAMNCGALLNIFRIGP